MEPTHAPRNTALTILDETFHDRGAWRAAAAETAHRRARQAFARGETRRALHHARQALVWHGGLMDADEHLNRYRLTLLQSCVVTGAFEDAVIAGETLLAELELGTLLGPAVRSRAHAWTAFALANVERDDDAEAHANLALGLLDELPGDGIGTRLEVLPTVLATFARTGEIDQSVQVAWAAEPLIASNLAERPDGYTADGSLVSQSSCFLLDDNDVVSLDAGHWLRDLEAGPPSPTTALRLLLAGVTMQAIAGRPTPQLDTALTKLRGVVACELYLPVDVPDALTTVREAIEQHRSVEVEYRSERDDAARRRELLPHRLWSKWGHWYLTARDVDDTETKQFRVDRMLSARVGSTPFDPPADVEIPDWFDLADAERTVRVRIREDSLESLPSPHRLGDATGVGDGVVELDVTVMSDRRLEHLLVSLPADAEVVAPPEYAALRRDHARRLLAMYA